ncbi:MAG TPA: enoyl-CoA hydratase/isomerase family protein [Actinobacteria bacterium]|nr:putative enoyl-CoA hydratase echA8 [bacterium BMS3Bbin02]HDL42364.1 enoyl-CoA hydratase/isomerase family protein [Actinomycetota bacterium]
MSLVHYEIVDAVAKITLDRPPVNALSGELIADIDEAVTRAQSDDIRAVVITGTKHFAAGADIKRFVDAFDSDSDEPIASTLSGVVRRLEQLEKPVIAAIQGYALGGGLELAMGADFRYVGESAKVGQPEILLGIIPGAGGTQRLQRLAGYQVAKELNMSGRQVGAEEAVALHIADKVCADDELVDVAMADAARWATGPTKAYFAVSRAMSEGYGRAIDEAMMVERDAFEMVFRTDDAKTGILAFVNKEKPDFRGS